MFFVGDLRRVLLELNAREIKNPRLRVRGVPMKAEILDSSLAVFNVEQVALNRHEQYFQN